VIDRVADTLERYQLLQRGRRIGVAVSGGADSVFLLHALHELGLAAIVLHINHKLRGAESGADEDFVADLAARLELPFASLSGTLGPGNVEQEARAVRYAFFEEQLSCNACDAVATGHTLDDQAETVLYRLLRGSGTSGLSGIRVSTGSGLIRPLIEIRRAEIRQWMVEREIAWREDRSNQDLEYARNRLRLEVIPQLAATINPGVSEVLAQTAEWAADEEDYWDEQMEKLAPLYLETTPVPEIVLIDTGRFLALPTAVQRRLLRVAVKKIRTSLRSIGFRHVEAIRAMMSTREGSGRLQIPDLDVYRSFDWLRLGPIGFDSRLSRDFEVPMAVPGTTVAEERGVRIQTEQAIFPGVYNDGLEWPERDRLDQERCPGPFLLRNWRPGDRYQAHGRLEAEKVKTLFQEFRVPLWERRSWPVITQNGAIVWSRRFGVAQEFAADPKSPRVIGIRELKESNPNVAASIEMNDAAAVDLRLRVELDAWSHRHKGSAVRQIGSRPASGEVK